MIISNRSLYRRKEENENAIRVSNEGKWDVHP
jgi:hypothetical protein